MSRKAENSIKSRVDDLRNWTSLFVAETMDGTLRFWVIDLKNKQIAVKFNSQLPFNTIWSVVAINDQEFQTKSLLAKQIKRV